MELEELSLEELKEVLVTEIENTQFERWDLIRLINNIRKHGGSNRITNDFNGRKQLEQLDIDEINYEDIVNLMNNYPKQLNFYIKNLVKENFYRLSLIVHEALKKDDLNIIKLLVPYFNERELDNLLESSIVDERDEIRDHLLKKGAHINSERLYYVIDRPDIFTKLAEYSDIDYPAIKNNLMLTAIRKYQDKIVKYLLNRAEYSRYDLLDFLNSTKNISIPDLDDSDELENSKINILNYLDNKLGNE